MIKVRKHRKNYSVYALDFETHNDDESIRKKETSIWLASFINDESDMKDESSYFYNIPSLLEKWKELTSQKRTKKVRPVNNLLIYVWNLSFEWSFIVPVLLQLGFHWEDDISNDSEYCFTDISTKSVTNVWNAKIKFEKDCGIVEFVDLCKIFPGSLRQVAKSFNLPTQKGEIDYRLNRLHGHVVTDEEKEYCYKDTKIVLDIINEMIKREDPAFFQILSAGSYAMKTLLKTGYKHTYKPYVKFREDYPELSQEENDFLRKGVEGGITYPTPRYQFVDIRNKKLLHIDMHQAHPTSAYYNKFPYGEGEYGKGKPYFDSSHICACRVRITFSDVKLHSVIKLIKEPSTITDYEIVLWEFELRAMRNFYVNLDVEFIDYYKYKCKKLPWRNFYADNYRKRLQAKADNDAFNVMYYKLLNNSSYGKLLEKPHNTINRTIIDLNGLINSDVVEKPDIAVNSTFTYLPVGSCIPAYSRVRLVETAMLFDYRDVVYFDTDSIFVIWNENTKKVWESNLIDKTDFLGGWGLEDGGLITNALFSCAKRYRYKNSQGEHVLRMAGINLDDFYENVRNQFNKEHPRTDITDINLMINDIYPDYNLDINNNDWIIKRAYRVKGGTIIDTERKETRVADKFSEIYCENNGKVI